MRCYARAHPLVSLDRHPPRQPRQPGLRKSREDVLTLERIFWIKPTVKTAEAGVNTQVLKQPGLVLKQPGLVLKQVDRSNSNVLARILRAFEQF